MLYLRQIPINNWSIINIKLIIDLTISYESQHFYHKKLKKKRGSYFHELLTRHQILNLMTLGRDFLFLEFVLIYYSTMIHGG